MSQTVSYILLQNATHTTDHHKQENFHTGVRCQSNRSCCSSTQKPENYDKMPDQEFHARLWRLSTHEPCSSSRVLVFCVVPMPDRFDSSHQLSRPALSDDSHSEPLGTEQDNSPLGEQQRGRKKAICVSSLSSTDAMGVGNLYI